MNDAFVNPDRLLASRRLIRQQLDEGKLGEPGLVRIHRWQPDGSLLPDLDLALWYIGKPPSVVYAVERAFGIHVHLGFPGGAMALINWVRDFPKDDKFYALTLIGSAGATYCDDHQNRQLLFQPGSTRALRTDERPTQANVDAQCAPSLPIVHDAVMESIRTKRAVHLPEAP